MPTKKLSEVHYLLPDRGKVVGTDRIIINQNSTTDDATLKVGTLLAEADSRAQAKADEALKAAKADACDKADEALAKAKAADPVYQKTALGNYMNYVYSRGQTDDTLTVLSSKMWTYQHSDRNQFLRFKQWGATNDTKQTYYSQVMLPNAWTGGNGLLRYDIYRRLDVFELREQNSTATEVVVVTPIFTTGGTRTCSLSAATSAKAGVMTAADKTLLSGLGKYLNPDPDNLTTLEALNAALDAMGPDTAQGTHLIKCWGIPLIVTLSVLNVSDKVLMQTITGSITTTAEATALATINAPGHYTTLVRYYQEGKWGKWGQS
jgi:vacuolar-type H+-ATPase subunit H